MQRDEFLDDRQAKSCAAMRMIGFAVDPVKPLEHDETHFRRNSRAVIAHFENGLLALAAQANADGSTIGNEFEGVGKKIEQYPLDHFTVGLNGKTVGSGNFAVNTPVFGQRFEMRKQDSG